ncbi:MAG: hypothetical protein JWR15_624 [Prosthecobacter sp.]|nr:hypothetical protein [Prosthecobacter sp.]
MGRSSASILMNSKTLLRIRSSTFPGLALALGLFLAGDCLAQQNKELTEGELVEYRPGDPALTKKVWNQFYAGDDESELPKPLIAAGKKMVPDICAAIAHPDMKMRRYAMTALGEIGDKAALPALESILKDKKELGYMRGDALYAIHKIDKALGVKYAKEFGPADEYLKMVADEILVK